MSDDKLDRQEAFSGTRAVARGFEIDVQELEAYLADRVEGFAGPIRLSQFKGGQSNPTYVVETPARTYVLRKKPPGNLLPSAHAVDREYRVIAALHTQGFPVPKAWFLCEDENVVGTAFYLMDKVDGRVVWEPHCPGMEAGERAAVYDAMNDTIAKLHGFDPHEIGLGDFGKPDNYLARQVARWSKNYVASRTENVPEMDALMDWLPDNLPESGPARLVHGDYRLDNLILAPDAPRVVAVLDWELSTLGDPLADFTYHLMQWVMPPTDDGSGTGSLVGHDLERLGIPSLEDYVAAYCARTGRDGIPDLDAYFAYNFFRLAAILQGIVGRVRDGTAANANAAAMARQVGPLAKSGWHWAQRAGAGA
ncbi:phosphotransferase family protein [Tepidamorphus sp. 3E244]|uniref:phosphotransferase family protein n=1 Tax=Tepidamorphus sp. 3E244 TaxID=3385498 RepID=UPI0038FC4C44